MDLHEIYTSLIAEHSRSTAHRHHLDCPDIVKAGVNPSCGDEISLEIKLDGDILADLAFTGEGCAISQASTSMMIDLLKGKTLEEARRLIDLFLAMIKREITDEDELEALDEAMALQNVSNMPARVKCAVLAWHTLEKATESSEARPPKRPGSQKE